LNVIECTQNSVSGPCTKDRVYNDF